MFCRHLRRYAFAYVRDIEETLAHSALNDGIRDLPEPPCLFLEPYCRLSQVYRHDRTPMDRA